MIDFLADKIKKRLALKEQAYTQIENRERHHIALGSATFSIDDVLILEPESKQLTNAQHPITATISVVLVTTKEVFSMGDKLLCVYGFISVNDIHPKFAAIANSIYQANVALQESKLKMVEQGMEFVS